MNEGQPTLFWAKLLKAEREATPAPWFSNGYSRVHGAVCPHTGIEAPACYPQHHAPACPRAGEDERLTGADLDRALGTPCACGYHWEGDCTPTVCEVPVIGGDTATPQGYKDMELMVELRNAAPRLFARFAALENMRALVEHLATQVEQDGGRLHLSRDGQELLWELPGVLAAVKAARLEDDGAPEKVGTP